MQNIFMIIIIIKGLLKLRTPTTTTTTTATSTLKDEEIT